MEIQIFAVLLYFWLCFTATNFLLCAMLLPILYTISTAAAAADMVVVVLVFLFFSLFSIILSYLSRLAVILFMFLVLWSLLCHMLKCSLYANNCKKYIFVLRCSSGVSIARDVW